MQVNRRMAWLGQKVRQLLASSVRLPLKMQHTFTCTPHISALEKWSVRFQPWPSARKHLTAPWFMYSCTYSKLMHPLSLLLFFFLIIIQNSCILPLNYTINKYRSLSAFEIHSPKFCSYLIKLLKAPCINSSCPALPWDAKLGHVWDERSPQFQLLRW